MLPSRPAKKLVRLNEITMKLTSGHHVRSIAAQASLFGLFAVVTAIVIIAVVQQNVLVLAAITAVAFAIVLPVETSLGMFAVLVPFDQVLALGNSGVTFTWVAGAFAGATLVLYGVVSGRFKLPPRGGLCWGLFVLWTATSIVWAIDPATSLKRLPTIATLFALYIVATSFRVTRRELSRIVLLSVAGGAVAASLIILQFTNHISIEGRASLVVGNLESNPNDLAFSLLLPFSLALGGVLSEVSLLKRTTLLAALALMATSILLVMSRGSLVALAAIVLVCLFRVGVRKRTLIPILVLAIPLLFVPGLFYQRLEQAFAGRGTGRYDIWLAGLEIVKRYPVIGVGLENFPVAYQKVAGYAHVFPSHGYVREAHNMYLQVCAETGMIGFALFIAAIWSQMKSVYPHLSGSGACDYFLIAVEAACWGQLVAGLSGNIQWNKPFWFAFILLALFTQEQRESELNGLQFAWDHPN
jgi:O-antigen ligase